MGQRRTERISIRPTEQVERAMEEVIAERRARGMTDDAIMKDPDLGWAIRERHAALVDREGHSNAVRDDDVE